MAQYSPATGIPSVRQRTLRRRVGWRTDRGFREANNTGMKTRLVIAAFALSAGIPAWQLVHAQDPVRAPTAIESVVQVHVHGLAMQRRGDEKGAFVAFLDAAERGYPPAQRRLGEIYDGGNSAVARDYEESVRWYQKAREGGEEMPPPKSHGSPFVSPIRVGP